MSRHRRKKPLQVSREVQEEFVNGIAEAMLALTSKAAGKPMWLTLQQGRRFVPQAAGNTAAPTCCVLCWRAWKKAIPTTAG